jgi:NADH-quinone oxidoreductase subunit L
MEGPTPVSALIHAATMVTAGVYLIARAHPIFELAPTIADLASGLGALTLLAAGLIALVQTDIKRVIAYSTMSQIGYMFLGAGLGAYGNGMFHLLTHAFFKALLFMAAGLVIHHLAGEQDIRLMGGVRHALPRTYVAFLVGSLALVGIPPLAGFFSKDSILASALAEGAYGRILFVAGLAGALLTGIYTFRLLFVVFLGQPSPLVEQAAHAHGHGHGDSRRREGPWTMTAPVAVLTVLAAIGGWIQIAGIWHPFADWLNPVAVGREHLALVEPSVTQDYVTSILAVGLGLVGIAVAWLLYAGRRRPVPRLAGVQRTLEHKLWFDEAYNAVFYRPAVLLARLWRRGIEEPLIGGSIAGVSLGARRAGGAVGEAQTGYLRSYALAIAGAVAVLVVVFVSVQ